MKTDLVEAILFLETDGIDVTALAKMLDENKEETEQRLGILEAELENSHRGIRLIKQGVVYRLDPAPHLRDKLLPLYGKNRRLRLTPAVMETLSIIAYTQPTTKTDVERLRGVSIESPLHYLLQEEYIHKSGKKEVPGNPALYSTTPRFLRVFGLNSLEELPELDAVDAGRFQKDETS